MCLVFSPNKMDELNAIDDRAEEILGQLKIPDGACACFLLTIDHNGGFSEVELIETNSPEFAARVAQRLENLAPTEPASGCLVGAKIPSIFPLR